MPNVEKGDYLRRISSLVESCRGIDLIIVTEPEDMRYLSGTENALALVIPRDQEPFLIAKYAFGDVLAEEESPLDVVVVKPEIGLNGKRDLKRIHEVIGDLISEMRARCVGMDGPGDLRAKVRRRVEKSGRRISIRDVGKRILNLRKTKDEKEIEIMRRSAEISIEVFYEVVPELREGLTEIEVASRFEYEFRLRGGDGSSFPTIVCFGENSFNAHHVPRPRKLRRDDLVLIDFGAKFEGYASDMTRTFVFGEPNSKVEKVWSAVFEAQRSAMEKIGSGVCCGLPDETARRVLNEKGLLDYYVHTLGHGVGLNVHEPPRLIIGSDERLEEGYVVTVEPGVYIKKWGGVRIEDTVVVRRRGKEVLTEKLGKFIRFKDM